MFGNMTGLTEFSGRGFIICEDPILLHFCLQMLNDKMLKPNTEICLKCEYQTKKKLYVEKKMWQMIKSAFFEKWV